MARTRRTLPGLPRRAEAVRPRPLLVAPGFRLRSSQRSDPMRWFRAELRRAVRNATMVRRLCIVSLSRGRSLALAKSLEAKARDAARDAGMPDAEVWG